MMDFVHVWYDDRYWSKISHSIIPIQIHDLMVKVTDLELYFNVKVFRVSLFLNFVVYLCHTGVWYDDRYLSKLLCSTIPTPIQVIKVKVKDLEFLC